MKASEIIINKLKSNGGEAYVYLLNGDKAHIQIVDDSYFISNKLPHQKIDFSIFDLVVDFLKSEPHFRAIKGGCRNSKVGEDKCSRGTVMYVIAKKYYGKVDGESSFDPLFVIASILDWANIVRNKRGYMELIDVTII